MPEAFGVPAGAAAALAAIERHDDAELDDGDASIEGVGPSSDAAGEHAVTGDIPENGKSDDGRQPPKPRGAKSSRIPTAGAVVRRFKTKRALAEHVIETSQRLRDAEARVEELTAQVATRDAVSTDDVNASVEDMARDVIGLGDAAAQIVVGEQYAGAVALDDEETERLVKLSARVARIKLGARVEQAPTLALAVCAVSIVLAKVIAYKIEVRDRERRGLPATT